MQKTTSATQRWKSDGRPLQASMRVRLLVLGNGAMGAEKQAIALGERVRRSLLQTSAVSRSNVCCLPVECVRVTLTKARRCPPLLQIIGARLTRDALFGYEKHDTRRAISLWLSDVEGAPWLSVP